MFQLISQLFNQWAHLKNHILYSMHQILLDVKKGNILRMEDNEINIKEAGYSTNYHEIRLNLFSYSLLLSKENIYRFYLNFGIFFSIFLNSRTLFLKEINIQSKYGNANRAILVDNFWRVLIFKTLLLHYDE